MNLVLVVKKYYHSFRKAYNQALYDSCLDPILKRKLIDKVKHHEGKLDIIYERLYTSSEY